MKQRVYFTVAVVLVAVVAGLWWTRGDIAEHATDTGQDAPAEHAASRELPPPGEPELETALPGVETDAAEHAAIDEPPEEEESPEPSEARFGAVSGEVQRFPRGGDYSGTRLTLHSMQTPNAPPLRTAYPRTDGSYSVDDVAPGLYVLRCEAPEGYGARRVGSGSAALARNETAVRVRAGETAEAATFQLGPASRFRGRVVDASGRPAPNARVEAITRRTRTEVADTTETDADGRFSFQGLRPDHPHIFLAYKDNLSSDLVTPDLDGADDILIELAAEPVRVSGRVLDAEGNPAPETRVEVRRVTGEGSPRRGPRPGPAVTDGQGRWRTELTPAGEYHFRVDVDGARVSKSVELSAGEERDGIELQLTAPADLTIAGVVREQGGDPVSAVVSAFGADGRRGTDRVGADGAFHIEGLAPGRHDLSAAVVRIVRPAQDEDSSPESIQTEPQVVKRGVEAGRDDVVLTVDTPPTLRGRLVDEAGDPVNNGTVILYAGDRHVGRATSGADGRFELFHVESATELFVNASSYAPKSVPLSGAGFSGGDIRLSRGGVIYGVARTIDGRSTQHARIQAVADELASEPMRLPRDGRRMAMVDQDGSFEVNHLSGGSITLVGYDPELGYANETLHLREGASVRQDLTFRPWITVEGRVTRDGAPVANAQVYGLHPYTVRRVRSQTDSNGRFKLTQMVPGANMVGVQLDGADGRRQTFERDVWVPEAGGGSIDFEIATPPEDYGAITGSLTPSAAAGWMAVKRVDESTGLTEELHFRPGGELDLDRLSPGTYEITVRAQTAEETHTVEVGAGERVEVSF